MQALNVLDMWGANAVSMFAGEAEREGWDRVSVKARKRVREGRSMGKYYLTRAYQGWPVI